MAQVPSSSRGGVGGDTSGFHVIRFPVAFDTPGLVPATYAITDFDEPTQTITVAGNRTAAFAAGVAVEITYDGFSNSPGSVVSSEFAAGETIVTLVPGSLLGDPAVPLTAIVAVGVTVYTPAVGEMLLGHTVAPITVASVSEAWDGATPTLKVWTESFRQEQGSPFVTVDATVADDPASDALIKSAFPGFTVGTEWRLWRFTAADPILVYVDDGDGLDPGATQGAAEVVLLTVLSAT